MLRIIQSITKHTCCVSQSLKFSPSNTSNELSDAPNLSKGNIMR